MAKQNDEIQAVVWHDDKLYLLDQRQLPNKETWLEFERPDDVSQAIKDMVVRGAPAIGITAAYGVVLASMQAWDIAGVRWKQAIIPPIARLLKSRPTAVNLHWAVDRMRALYKLLPDAIKPETALLTEAQQIHDEDITANRKMARLGAALLPDDCSVLTHCNTGAIATGGFGTALGVIRQAYAEGKLNMVYVDETRPWLQGARLTAWELDKENIPFSLQVDSAAAYLMATRQIDWVIVGADRISSNGDVANKIGTYMLAILAKYHGVKMMVVAPTSTIDWQLNRGDEITIEQREGSELTHFNKQRLTPEEISVFNPVFDITPAALIDAIVTEKGVILSPSLETMRAIEEQ